MSGRRQGGVALINALLVVALATSVAVAMVSRQQFDIRRTGNLLQAGQAGLYADGVEVWASQVLRRDRQENRRDHREETWATILPPMPVAGGSIAGYIDDLQGRFNLNSLVVAGQPDPEAVAQFQRLLAVLREGNPAQAPRLSLELAAVVIDWIDADQEITFPGGAEDETYMRHEQPYRTANGPLHSPTELLLLEGVDAQLYQLLRPHVTALPVEGAPGTRINVNTATPEVLRSLVEGMSPGDAEALIEGRGAEGYADVAAFLAQEALAGRALQAERLTVASEYFLVVGQVQFGALSQQRHSVLQRDATGASRTLMRAQGTY
ncbi:MAG: type II secretion system minor pseudopilin GspK [Gammaproteobacteria bacterium]|nr:type II secretion system minor pseudopilin GspK [Gammaproteobacteria bacterium]